MAKKTEKGGEQPSWSVQFFQRHEEDDAKRSIPARTFLGQVPAQVRATMMRVLLAVSKAPPPSFSGGGFWEAMHDEMSGFYEVRVDHDGMHYRLFCLLERKSDKNKLEENCVVVVDGDSKKFKTTIPKKRYLQLKELRSEYLARIPRSFFDDDKKKDDG